MSLTPRRWLAQVYMGEGGHSWRVHRSWVNDPQARTELCQVLILVSWHCIATYSPKVKTLQSRLSTNCAPVSSPEGAGRFRKAPTEWPCESPCGLRVLRHRA